VDDRTDGNVHRYIYMCENCIFRVYTSRGIEALALLSPMLFHAGVKSETSRPLINSIHTE